MKFKDLSISWLLHSIKILLGDESIRRYIIIKKFPTLKRQLVKDIRTFNPFLQGKTREYKLKEIEKYLNYVIKFKKDIFVFSAANVQQDLDDIETHYQSFIVDNLNKKAYAIDPAFNKNAENFEGIYYPEITFEIIKPFLEKKGYDFQFISLSRPAQSTTNDVFCQSWSLLILLDLLTNNKFRGTNTEFKIPETTPKKYEMLINFYKDIFINSMPELMVNLQEEYNGSIIHCEYENCPTKEQKKKLLAVNIPELLRKMTKSDIQ